MMKTRTLAILACLAPLVLAGCGTREINQQQMGAFDKQIEHQAQALATHADGCATTAAGCEEDMCRVAVQLACHLGAPEWDIQMPRLRSPGEEFARGVSPITSLLNTGLQVWGAGWLVDRSGQNMVDLVGEVSGLAGQIQGPVDNSVNVGGNYGDTDQSTTVGGNYGDTRGDVIGRDQIGRDQRIGDDISDSCVGDMCRNVSDGPIDQSDNSITDPPDDDEPADPDP